MTAPYYSREGIQCRVEQLLAIGCWVAYTSKKLPVTEALARSLAEHLRRNKTGYRIINHETGEVIDQWPSR